MYIYIDEAGNFTQPSDGSAFSLVAALVVPEATNDQLLSTFKGIRDSWTGSTDVECKGSSLTATQTASVISLLASHDVLLEFLAVDMSTHSPPTIRDFKARTAAAVTENLTAAHHPNIVAQLTQDREHIAHLSDQLFVQFGLTVELVLKTLETAPLYYVQRIPAELAQFRWLIDRKDRTLTEMERLWIKLILPYGESHLSKKPLGRLPNADYSHFERFCVDASTPGWASHIAFLERQYGVGSSERHINAKLLLSEHREFVDSQDNLGLQLADITATTLRRALNNRLEREGWEDLGRLTVRQKSSSFLQLGRPSTPVPDVLSGHAEKVGRILTARAKPMSLDLDRFFPEERPEKRRPLPIPKVKIGRNDPCPCGSGRKYKKCCEI